MAKALNWNEDVRNLLDVELAKCKGGYDDQPPDSVYEGGWLVQPKLDGMRKSIQIGDSKVWIVSRNREDKLKGVDAAGQFVASEGWGWSRELLGKGNLSGTILDGELMIPCKGVADAMHAWSSAPQTLRYCVFDCLFWRGVDLRLEPYEKRMKHAAQVVTKLKHPNVDLIVSLPATMDSENYLMRNGEEGVILVATQGAYGNRRLRWKKKAQNSVDLVVMGCSEKMDGGSPKNGIKPKPTGRPAAAKVGLWKDGKLIEVGWMMNLTDEDKALTMAQFDRKYLGKVAEAVCSGWEGVRFRWVRWARWRSDKGTKDCQFSEQVGRGSKKLVEVGEDA